MELVILLVLLLVVVKFLSWLSRGPEDNREPYIRNSQGQALALHISAPADDMPQHESFIHDGTAHQNQAQYNYTRVRWFLFIPYPVEWEERWYPLTNNGMAIDFQAIQQRIDNANLRRYQTVEIAGMPTGTERAAIRRENGQQLARGVNGGDLEYSLTGREKKGFFGTIFTIVVWSFWIGVGIMVLMVLAGLLTMAGGPL